MRNPADKSKVRVQRIVEPLIARPELHSFSFGESHIKAVVDTLVVLLGSRTAINDQSFCGLDAIHVLTNGAS
jgi:hypothetical protein